MFSLSKTIIANPRGSTRLMTMGVVAFVIAVSVDVIRRAEVSLRLANQSNMREQTTIVSQSIAARLQNPETCLEILKGSVLEPGRAVEATLNYVLNPEFEESKVTTSGSQLSADVWLERLALSLEPNPDMRTRIRDSKGEKMSLVRYQARMIPHFRDRDGLPLPSDPVPGLRFLVWLDHNHNLVACFGRSSAGALCNEMGGFFVARTEPFSLGCRQSLQTEKIFDGTVRKIAACRVGGVRKDKTCERFDQKFSEMLLQEGNAALFPARQDEVLCATCD